MRHDYQVIDADAHVIEPDDLWSRYFDPELAHRAPRHLNRAFAIEVDGHAINTPADWEPGNTTFAELFPNAYARGFDAVAQLADMDVEGVDLAFLYPSFGLFATASKRTRPGDRRRASRRPCLGRRAASTSAAGPETPAAIRSKCLKRARAETTPAPPSRARGARRSPGRRCRRR